MSDGKAWFERRKGKTSYRLRPSSSGGWALTIGYAVAAIVLGHMLLAGIGRIPATSWFAGFVVLLAGSALYLLAAFRLSAPARPKT